MANSNPGSSEPLPSPQPETNKLSETNIRLIFGLKLKQFRKSRKLSLKELSEASGLSISYLNEIEKGKKYPKTDKALALAQALKVPYDDLISLKLVGPLEALSQILSTPFLQNFPLQEFGITTSGLMEFMSNHPDRFSTLITTVARIAHRHELDHEQLNVAALRSHIELHQNYFPHLERAADSFRRSQNWPLHPCPDWQQLAAFLSTRFNYHVDLESLDKDPPLRTYRSAYKSHRKNPTLFLNPRLAPSQLAFHLAREIAFCTLGLEDRANSDVIKPHHSFHQLFNNFQASYFAGCLLLNRQTLTEDIRHVLAQRTLNSSSLHRWLFKYNVTPELLFHRLAQLLPTRLSLPEMFFLRVDYNNQDDSFKIGKELHFSRIQGPAAFNRTEHYCQNWPHKSFLKSLTKNAKKPTALISRVHFNAIQEDYLLTSMAYPSPLIPGHYSCVTLGLLLDTRLKRIMRFWNDDAIENITVAPQTEASLHSENTLALREEALKKLLLS
ncbi:MAG: helix-turn-helix domain-containing protein [Verrucomicrobiota bacterium]